MTPWKTQIRMLRDSDFIDSDMRREGYSASQRFRPSAKAAKPQHRLRTSTEERFGSLLAGGAAIWVVYAATTDYASLWQLRILPPGPLELCALGVLMWLHAKWRRSVSR